MIQGGDPTGDGTRRPRLLDARQACRANAAYTPGVVAMAKAGNEPPGTAGSQFFVVTGAGAGLPPDYALLGKVTKGMDVVAGDRQARRPGQRRRRHPSAVGGDREGDRP